MRIFRASFIRIFYARNGCGSVAGAASTSRPGKWLLNVPAAASLRQGRSLTRFRASSPLLHPSLSFFSLEEETERQGEVAFFLSLDVERQYAHSVPSGSARSGKSFVFLSRSSYFDSTRRLAYLVACAVCP